MQFGPRVPLMLLRARRDGNDAAHALRMTPEDLDAIVAYVRSLPPLPDAG